MVDKLIIKSYYILCQRLDSDLPKSIKVIISSVSFLQKLIYDPNNGSFRAHFGKLSLYNEFKFLK